MSPAMRASLLYMSTAVLGVAASRYSVAILTAPQGFTNVTMTGLNASGQVVGYGTPANSPGVLQAFVTGAAGPSLIPSPQVFGTGIGFATAINNSGQVAGSYYCGADYFMQPLYCPFIGTTSGSTVVPRLSGWFTAQTASINNSGQVAGSFALGNNDFIVLPYQPFVGNASGSTVIPVPQGWTGAQVLGINDSGQVAGFLTRSSGGDQAFIGTVSGSTAIPLPAGWSSSRGAAINSSGQVAGNGSAGSSTLAFIGTVAGSTAIPPVATGATVTSATLNDAGIVVGSASNGTGWIWDGQTTRALTDLAPAGWTILSATAINNRGVILARGSFQGSANQDILLNPSGIELVPVTPCRVLDTRNANGTFGGPFISGSGTRTVPVPSSSCNIPASASAYSVNVTVAPRKSSLGYVTVWPAGQTQPLASTLNSPNGSVVSNAAIVPAGINGGISFFATDDTDLVLDINGYFTDPTASTLAFYSLPPCRVLDTRQTNGVFGGPFIPGNSSRSFPIPNSSCGAGFARAYSLNVTVVPHAPLGYLTVWPSDQPRPLASTLNSPDGSVRAVAAIVPASAMDGSVAFFATDDTDLVVDINGYFDLPGHGARPLDFFPIPPCRVTDTRNPNGPLGGPILAASASRTFPIASSPCGLPSDAGAYSLNMTVVYPDVLGYLSVWNTGAAQPTVSTLNGYKGIVAANAAIVPEGLNGSINVFVTDATHLVIDTNGYFR